MGRPLRSTDPSLFHLITIRTDQAAIWMLPDSRTNRTIGGILARYQEIFRIEIYAYSVMGNHYHILVRAPYGYLDEFLENVNREIAKRMNRRHSRSGKFWGRRYDDQTILSNDDAIEAFLYVISNPTKHGLVSHPREWPGLNCYQQVLNEGSRHFNFVHYSVRKAGFLVETDHELALTPLPQFAKMPQRDRKRALLKLINARVGMIREKRKKEMRGFATAAIIKKQVAGTIPKEVARSPRIQCYSIHPAQIKEFYENRTLLRVRYAQASFEFRSGNYEVQFPTFTFKPPLHRRPRVIPFGHLIELQAA